MTNEYFIKQEIATNKGYPSWDKMYNWIAREGEKPSVVAQLVESFTSDYYLSAIMQWQDFNQEQQNEGGKEVTFNQFLKL